MEDPKPTSPKTDRLTLILRWVVGIILAVVVICGGWLAYAYSVSPEAIRHPSHDHFHLRMQVVADGKSVNFGDEKYQTEFNKDICTADLTKQPIHFHDQLDQFVHIHWKNISGGLLLKNYGWNFIGGPSGTLGYRFDQLPKVTQVPVHGLDLPTASKGDNYYIYTGDDTSYTKRDWDSFIKSNLRDFFAGKTTSLNIFDRIIPAAYAHGDEAELTKLNDVVGNVVIFAQKDVPTDAQIKERFAHLIDLPMSACGG